MAEEFQGGVCGGNWWDSSINLFGSSPCLSAVGGLGWLNHHGPINGNMTKTASRSNISDHDNSAGSVLSDGGSSTVIQDAVQKPHHPTADGNMSISSSTLPMTGGLISFPTSTTTHDWNQDFLYDSGTSEEDYSHMLQASAGVNSSMSSSVNSFEKVNKKIPLEQQLMTNSLTSSNPRQEQSPSFLLNSASYDRYTSSLLQTLFDDADSDQPQQLLSENLQAKNYSSSTNNYLMNISTEFLPSLNNRAFPMVKQTLPKKQLAYNPNLRFTTDNTSKILPSIPNYTAKKPNLHNFGTAKHHSREAKNSASVPKKVCNEPALKRQRIEPPSPLPTFKVRKEKLGDRITALQQLVSPFGKTDTASVLHEAIEYIKFLHDQVSVLTTPYFKNGSHPQQRQQVADKIKDEERSIKDLESRGLCLVPISSTFPVVAAETTTDFWTPTFRGRFQ